MRPTEKHIGKRVVAKTVQGHESGDGKIIGYCDAPTVTIERADGSTFNWRADLCEVEDLEAELKSTYQGLEELVLDLSYEGKTSAAIAVAQNTILKALNDKGDFELGTAK